MQNVSTAPNNNVQNVNSNLSNINNQVNKQSSTQMSMPDNVNIQNNKPVQSNQTTMNNSKNNFSNAINIIQNKNIDFTKMPVVDIVNSIILTGVNVGGSDIHMDPTYEGITVRIRVDGLLRDYFK